MEIQQMLHAVKSLPPSLKARICFADAFQRFRNMCCEAGAMFGKYEIVVDIRVTRT